MPLGEGEMTHLVSNLLLNDQKVLKQKMSQKTQENHYIWRMDTKV